MRWLVVVRHEVGVLKLALKISRSPQGHLSCVEPRPPSGSRVPAPGMTWWVDGRYRLTTEAGWRLKSRRRCLDRLGADDVAYRMPGRRLVQRTLPDWEPGMDGVPIEIDLARQLEDPECAELQLVVAPGDVEPEPDGPLLGRWPVLAGAPSIWLLLVRSDEEAA